MLREGRVQHVLMDVPFDPAAALISREKVTGYLLSDSHPVGRYKAAAFKRYMVGNSRPMVYCEAPARAATSSSRCGLFFPTNSHPGW